MIKPSIPSGSRDFSSEEVYKRQYIFNIIRGVFERYGYLPIETPTMENLETLEGKYGEEGDRLLFRILNSGDFKKDISASEFDESSANQLISKVSAKGLRYDLTIPFARFVVMHQNEITFPFKRYQIQPVYRADRPQRGRYREFYQCDADVIGSDSLVNEMELIRIFDEVFLLLGIAVTIKLNNRKILSGMAASINASDKFSDITIAVDKLDKIGIQGVRQQLITGGLSESQIHVIEKFFSLKDESEQMLHDAKSLLINSETGQKGIAELKEILQLLKITGITKASVEVDFTLARGLDYYTGAIMEVKSNDVKMGSIGGGGRYDDLTGVFGLKGVSGVGISFGADRIYDVMEELKLFPIGTQAGTKILFIHFNEASLNYSLPLLQKVRAEGISAEIYPSSEKIKKQLKYADEKRILFVVLVGEDEMKTGKLTLKNMQTGAQESLTIEEIVQKVKVVASKMFKI
ncbi:MAG: histidine--tRNA ligase [Chitinophagales bacterium]|nr:histidine--tRNA ligase [Chitinophagales bacterium]